MQQKLKKIYLYATRNDHSLIRSNKYLPIKNSSVNYQTLFEVTNNIKQLHFTIGTHQKSNRKIKKKHLQRMRNQSEQIKHKSKINSSINLIQNDKKSRIKQAKINRHHMNNITIINNSDGQQPNQQVKQNKSKTISPNQKYKNNKNQKEILINPQHLDNYIQQYLYKLKQSNPQMKEIIQQDRQKFIKQAILQIKQKILSDYKKQPEPIKKSNKQIIKYQKKTNSSIQLPLLSQRHVYQKGLNSLNRIGKTFYINQLSILKKTVELEAKNRERAQRVFRKKLLNIQRQVAFSNRSKHQLYQNQIY